MNYREARSMTCVLLEAAEDGRVSWESIARAALDYMSEDDVADLVHCDFEELEEEDEDEED